LRETKLIIQERKTLKRECQKRWRENKKKLIATANCDEDAVTVSNDLEFPNRMSKCRLLQKLKSLLLFFPQEFVQSAILSSDTRQ
jgi:hypothetical protein